MDQMITLLSLALSAMVIAVSLRSITFTVSAELPYVLRALGIDDDPIALPSVRAPRERLTRPAKGMSPVVEQRSLRAA